MKKKIKHIVFSTFSAAMHKMNPVALLGFFTDRTDRFCYPSYTSTSEIPTLLYTWSPKNVPISGGASPYWLFLGVPLPPHPPPPPPLFGPVIRQTPEAAALGEGTPFANWKLPLLKGYWGMMRTVLKSTKVWNSLGWHWDLGRFSTPKGNTKSFVSPRNKY